MKIIIKRKEVLRSFLNIQGIVEKSGVIPILSNILLEAKDKKLSLYATNLKISFMDECLATVEQEGSVALDAKKIFEIIKEAPGDEIILEKKENNWVKISSGKIVYSLAGNSALEFPEKIKVKEKEPTKIKAIKLTEMIKKTIFAVAEGEDKGIMGGELWEVSADDGRKLKMVATDAHRLSCVERREEGGEIFKEGLNNIIVPQKGLQEIRRLLEDAGGQMVELWVEEGNLVIKKDKTLLAIRLMEGEFPDYKKVLSFQGSNKIRINTLRLMDALKRVSIITLEDRMRIIKIILSPQTALIAAHSSETGEAKEEIEIDNGGSEQEIYFNLKYIWDSLNCLESESFFLEIKGSKEPIKILPEKDSGHILIVMPMVF
jgi:DNA polymerase-3 subunit beta